MDDYARMARMIDYLDEHFSEQPSLDALAEVAGLSPFHFHKLFTKWVGVTPKDFIQCLTLNHARSMLENGRSVFDAALDSGLSGAGRLHDLTVTLEAASPGEIKSGGSGLEITYGMAVTAFGECLIAQSPRGVCRICFVDDESRNLEIYKLAASWPNAQLVHDNRVVKDTAIRMLSDSSNRQPGNLRAWVCGTEFQLKIWKALLEIPLGNLVSYGQLARAIGNAGASRAVGSAVGANPVAVLIPCHRVIRETGVVKGYRWGTGRKRALIAWESCRGVAEHQPLVA